jgi:hypothetical protein
LCGIDTLACDLLQIPRTCGAQAPRLRFVAHPNSRASEGGAGIHACCDRSHHLLALAAEGYQGTSSLVPYRPPPICQLERSRGSNATEASRKIPILLIAITLIQGVLTRNSFAHFFDHPITRESSDHPLFSVCPCLRGRFSGFLHLRLSAFICGDHFRAEC